MRHLVVPQNIPTPMHQMIFNKPFLIILERANAKMPYFRTLGR